ncbi:hypothetical protein Tco_0070893 [Tanacetum coccineum]
MESAEASHPDADSDLAKDFVPWETLSALEEVLGALKTTGISTAQIANMWSVKGGSLGWLGLQCPAIDTEDLSGVECEFTISSRRDINLG